MKLLSILSAASLAHRSYSAYVIQHDYNPTTFVDMFDAYSGKDPTDGFVQYLDMKTGVSKGLVKSTAESVILSVDSQAVTPQGRPSMRLESKQSYSSGLIIGDFAHMPGSICGAWPAFWTLGPDWPSHGEIDILEGVNSQSINSMTLHTGPGCSIGSAPGSFVGNIKTPNCDIKAPGQGDNVGCGVTASGASTYGNGFNVAGGGVYAAEWTADHIAIYFFPRNAIPADIIQGQPNPSAWGQPQALFKGGCNIPAMFKNHKIVINTTFCGQWAGSKDVWGSDKTCSAKAATCNDYVANNPAAFKEAYWEINSLKVYQLSDAAAPLAAPPVPYSSALPVPVASGAPVPVASGAPVSSGAPVYPAPGQSVPAGEPAAPVPSKTRRRKYKQAQATAAPSPQYKRLAKRELLKKRQDVQDHVKDNVNATTTDAARVIIQHESAPQVVPQVDKQAESHSNTEDHVRQLIAVPVASE